MFTKNVKPILFFRLLYCMSCGVAGRKFLEQANNLFLTPPAYGSKKLIGTNENVQ